MSDRLPVITGKDLVRALRKAGWDVCHIRGSHHQLVHGETGRKITVPVHAGKDLKRGLITALLKDLGVSSQEFKRML